MKIATLLALFVTFQAPQEQVTYTNTALGLSFTHPASWQVTTNKKWESKFLIPVEGSQQKSTLEIYPVPFDAETSVWQLTQTTMAKQLRRQVARQWEESIMQAPLLLTQVNATTKQGPRVELTGLIYSKTAKKLMFKLSSAPEDYEKTEFAWRTALQTLRTVNGDVLKADDGKGNRVKGGKEDLQSVPTTIKVLDDSNKVKNGKPVKGPVVVKAKAGGKDVELRLPQGWSAEPKEDGTFILRGPEIAGTATVTVASTLDSDPAPKALFKASSVSLNDYLKVAKREEPPAEQTKAGAILGRVWRSGTSAKGDLFTCDAVAISGDFYVVLAYRSEDATKASAERKAIEALLDQMSVELPQ
jgi:hypothetical protein